MRVMLWGLVLAFFAGPTLAQEPNDAEPSIQVAGTATVSTRPDLANLIYWVSGEGQTADQASAALAAKQAAIVGGLAGLLGADALISAGDVLVLETRSPQCDDKNRPRLSEGPCEVTGYVARLQGTVRTGAVDKAATAAGLAARLGAGDARVQRFQLSDPAEAQRRASAAAIANARAKAEAAASAAGVRLGNLISLSDLTSGGEIVVRAREPMSLASVSASEVSPVEIDISPRPIDIAARVVARFAITR